MDKRITMQGGASMVEYCLLAALIAMVALGAVRIYGKKVHDTLDKVNQECATYGC